jgi:hypothetical protein
MKIKSLARDKKAVEALAAKVAQDRAARSQKPQKPQKPIELSLPVIAPIVPIVPEESAVFLPTGRVSQGKESKAQFRKPLWELRGHGFAGPAQPASSLEEYLQRIGFDR